MARIRTIKPEFFKHYELWQAEEASGLPLRLAFAGLWTVCDREGRFQWSPPQIKIEVLPYDNLDFSAVLDALEQYGYVIRYEVGGKWYGFIPSWKKHQVINQREAKSTIPAPPDDAHVHAHAEQMQEYHVPRGVNIPAPLRQTVLARDGNKCLRCGAGEDLTVDHIFPQSIGGTHAIQNLRTLCRACNSARPVAGQGLLDDLEKDGFTLNDMERTCMHVQTHGEGKGKEGKGTSIPPSEGAASAPGKPVSLEVEAYRFGKEVLGKSAGGLVTKLRKHCNGDFGAVMDLLDEASGKEDAKEWISAVLRGEREQTTAEVLDEIERQYREWGVSY